MNMFGNPIALLLKDIGLTASPFAIDRIARLSDEYCTALLALRLIPPEQILTPDECRILAEIESGPVPVAPLLHPSLVIILKATRLCNLRCTYCNSWRAGPGQVMDFATLAKLMRETLMAPALRKMQIVWHGGEVTLLPIEYLRKALWLQERYRSATVDVDNCIQTNGTRLNAAWVDFLAAHRISVGLSVDASPDIHDRRRVTKNGKGSWTATLRGLDLLRKANVPFGILAVIDEHALELGAAAYLAHLASLDVRGVALLNALPANEPDRNNSDTYFDWGSFQGFLREMFAIWWTSYRPRFEIRELQALVDAVEGRSHGLCIYAGNCMGKYLTVEPDGRISACEKYVGNPAYDFGSLHRDGVADLLARSSELIDARAVVDLQKSTAKAACSYFRYCQGGCPHDDLNNRRFGHADTNPGCCGMHALIDDIMHAVHQEEKDDDSFRPVHDPRGLDLGTGHP